MILQCTNKGCYASGEHLLEEKAGPKGDGQVICIECGEVCEFPRTTKVILKSLGQVRKQVSTGLQFLCKECGTKDRPVIKKLSATQSIAMCKNCDKQLNIHPSFIQALKFIKADQDDGTTTSEKK